MAIVGNFFLVILTLLTLVTFPLIFGKTPPTSGDAVVGYPFAVIFLNIAMLVCVAVITGVSQGNGSLEWVNGNSGLRALLIWGGMLAMIATNAVAALFKYEPGGVPQLIRILSGFAPALLPIIWVFSGAFLVNAGLRAGVNPSVYKIPLLVAFGIGVIGTLSAIFSMIEESNRNAKAIMESREEDQKRYHQNYLDEIDSTDATKSILGILVFTDYNHDADVRERALAKIKSDPKWHEKVIEVLESDYYAEEAFTFLASNDVDDKAVFAAPIETGIRKVAQKIRKDIRGASHPSHLYEGQFMYPIERVLRTVDKYQGTSGMDYMPAVRDMRAALDEPSEYKKVKFVVARELDGWLKKKGG